MCTTTTPSFRRDTRTATLLTLSVTLLFLTSLSGCAAIHTSIAKADLDVRTQMSDSVFLDPVGKDKRTIFIQVRNTSDQPTFNIQQPLKVAIAAKGYRIIEDPNQAHFKLQAQILSVSKTDPTAAASALNAGYGGAIGGAVLGGTVGAVIANSRGMGIGAGAGALAGGLAGTIANAMVKDVTYVAITDIQITQKTKEGVSGTQKTKADIAQGTGTKVEQAFEEVVKEKKYRTRVMSTANQVNLEYEDAAPQLNAGLTRVLAGLF